MDLLEQYKQQNPGAFQEKKPPRMMDEYGRTYTGMIAFVMWLSGGRIRDTKQASIVLLILSAIIIGGALMISFLPSASQNDLPKNFEKIDQSQYAIPRQ